MEISTNDKEYRNAVRTGDTEGIRKALEKGIDIRQQQKMKNAKCMLLTTVHARRADILELIIGEYYGDGFVTAFSAACGINDSNIINVFINDIQKEGTELARKSFRQGKAKDAPLISAIEGNHRGLIHRIIPFFTISHNAICAATKRGMDSELRKMLDSYDKQNDDSTNIFDLEERYVKSTYPHYAATDSPTCLKMLWERKQLNEDDCVGLLKNIINDCNHENFDYILPFAINGISEIDFALMLKTAAEKNDSAMVEKLLQLPNDDWDMFDICHGAMCAAAVRKHGQIIECILPFSDPTRENSAPLLWAARVGATEIVRRLAPLSDAASVRWQLLEHYNDNKAVALLDGAVLAIKHGVDKDHARKKTPGI